jgi:hypothetical protein
MGSEDLKAHIDLIQFDGIRLLVNSASTSKVCCYRFGSGVKPSRREKKIVIRMTP